MGWRKVLGAGLAAIFVACAGTEADHDSREDDVVESMPGCERYAEPVPMGHLPEGLDEISGLAMSSTPGILWMHEDSGAGPLLYAVDIASGARIATMTLAIELAYDWEDMAAGPCGAGRADRCLYVGDIGDGGMREILGIPPRIHRIVEPDPAGGDRMVDEVGTMLIAYPDGVAHNAEALVVDAIGRVFVLTKDEGNLFRLFGGPFEPGDTPVLLGDHGTFDISSMRPGEATKVTAADFSIPHNRLIVRGWTGMLEYVLPEDRDLAFLEGIPPRVVPCADEGQGETVVYGDGGYYQVSEGADALIFHVPCGDAL